MASSSSERLRAPYDLGPLPMDRRLVTIDERIVIAPIAEIFEIARLVEHWPAYLPHYRFVRFRERATDGGGLVEMSANRPFGPVGWPTWWLSEMAVQSDVPLIRFRHVGGVTTRMDVAWEFHDLTDGGTPRTQVRIVHTWNGPRWPIIGSFAATAVIGPVFVHGIASRTLSGLAAVAERQRGGPTGEHRIPTSRGAAPADATRVTHHSSSGPPT